MYYYCMSHFPFTCAFLSRLHLHALNLSHIYHTHLYPRHVFEPVHHVHFVIKNDNARIKREFRFRALR